MVALGGVLFLMSEVPVYRFTATPQGVNTLKCFKDLNLKAEARIWP